ncbi:MAG: hypothetical protein V4696_03855 [Pseudomonadota bacterium]
MTDLDDLDLGAAAVVAAASSYREGKRNWTVLTIYVTPSKEAGLSYIAEIVGESTVTGHARRQRRKAFDTVAAALKWRAFEDSALYDQLRDRALEAMEKNCARFR